MGAGVAADPGEAVLQEPAGEESVDNRGDDGAPRAVDMGEPLVVDQAQVPEAAVEQAIFAIHGQPAALLRGWATKRRSLSNPRPLQVRRAAAVLHGHVDQAGP